jgi:Uma2 family endonuclease
MASQTKPYISPEEYLEIERRSQHKSEYFDGKMVAMSGATESHNLISTNISSELNLQMKGRPCKVYANDMRVKITPTGLYAYPDVVALCGQAKFDDAQKDTLVNPTVIVEVLSDSTEAYDRGFKSEHYRRLESLREYLLVAQDKTHVEHYVRQADNTWLFSEASGLNDEVKLSSIDCVLRLSEVYDKVEIGPRNEENAN